MSLSSIRLKQETFQREPIRVQRRVRVISPIFDSISTVVDYDNKEIKPPDGC